MDQWFAVIHSDTGEAVSFTPFVAPADVLTARRLETAAIDHPPVEGERWDPATRTVVPHTTDDEIAALTAERDRLDARIADLESKRAG